MRVDVSGKTSLTVCERGGIFLETEFRFEKLEVGADGTYSSSSSSSDDEDMADADENAAMLLSLMKDGLEVFLGSEIRRGAIVAIQMDCITIYS